MEGIMKIEDIKIEDAADANYVIRKYFNNDLKDIKMTQLEQLVLTVYEMGKKNGVATDSASDETETETETESKSADKAPAEEKHFKLYEKVKVLEDIEIGHSGEFVKTNDVGTLILMKGKDAGTILFEAGEDGEMIEVDISFDKLDKAE